MELEQLRIFLAVVEQGGFRAAAAALYISHSTTCRRVAALEEELGVRLLERPGGGGELCLTPAGETLFREARELLHRAGLAAEAVRRAGGACAPPETVQEPGRRECAPDTNRNTP